MTATDPAAVNTPADTRQPVIARTRGELVGRLIDMRISALDAHDLADLDEGDQYTIDLGNHACGGRAADGPHHDLWIIAVTGGWWLLVPVPGGDSCQAVAGDGMYAPRPRSAGRVPGQERMPGPRERRGTMSRKLGERRQLARQLRKRLAAYLYWLQACGRDEAKAHRVLLAARAELGRLVGLDAEASGIGGGDPALRAVERQPGQLEEGERLLAEAGARIQAGTRTLAALADLEAVVGGPGGPDGRGGSRYSARLHRAAERNGGHGSCPARDTTPGHPNDQQPPQDGGEGDGLDYEAGHRAAAAPELTYAAGCPLRYRYGFAAVDQDVLFVVDAVFREPDDARARFLIRAANGDQIELAMPGGTITDEPYELAIVRALRPLAQQRRNAVARSLF